MASTETKNFLAEDRVLVYQYRPNNSPVVQGGLAVIPRHELDNILATHPNLQKSTKPLAVRARYVDIYQADLVPHVSGPAGAEANPPGNEASNVAGVKLPLQVWLEGLLRGKGKGWKEIFVLTWKIGSG